MVGERHASCLQGKGSSCLRGACARIDEPDEAKEPWGFVSGESDAGAPQIGSALQARRSLEFLVHTFSSCHDDFRARAYLISE